MAEARNENPHVDNGLITEDGNINLVVHATDVNPWRGTLLAVRVVRLFSLLLSSVTVYLTYRIAKEVAPNRPEIALGAAAFNAFLPMFLFISGAVNNDNLAIMLASLALWLMIRAVTRRIHWRRWRFWLLLGLVIGLALLTKEGTFGLLPLAWGTGFVVARQTTKKTPVSLAPVKFMLTLRWLLRLLGQSVLMFIVMMLPVALVAGWWYWRNIVLYGDLLGWSAFIAVLGQRAHPASLLQLWGERRGFLMAFWGLFGGVNVPMPQWIYAVLNGVLVIAVIGFVVYLLRIVRNWFLSMGWRPPNLRLWLDNLLNFVTVNFALVVCLLFSGAVVFGLIQWATTTWSSQGRLVFTALSALAALLIVGLVGWMPRRFARAVVAVLAVFLFVVALAAPFLWIQPAYDVEAYGPPRPFVMQPKSIDYNGKLRLVGAAVETAVPDQSTIRPGDSVWVHLEWEVLESMTRDWSVFVHLNDPVLGRPIAQRDMYLGQGLLLTSWLEPGERITNSYKLTVPETAVAPANLELAVGLYDFNTMERMPVAGEGDVAVVAVVLLETTEGLYPNPVEVNFENELMLLGYEVTPRRAAPGDTVDLTLYWQAQRPLTTDYTFFAQIVDADTTRWASHDITPSVGTSAWPPNEVQTMQLTLPLAADAPPGLYPLIVGVYIQTPDGNFERLQLVTADGRLTDDFLQLTPVRVD